MPPPNKPPGMPIADWIDTFDHLLTVKELAPLLGVSFTDLYDSARDGSAPHLRWRGKIRFDPHRTAEWLRSCEV